MQPLDGHSCPYVASVTADYASTQKKEEEKIVKSTNKLKIITIDLPMFVSAVGFDADATTDHCFLSLLLVLHKRSTVRKMLKRRDRKYPLYASFSCECEAI